MEKKIFKTYREKRERILTVMIPYHRHLLQFMKERLIPQLEDKKLGSSYWWICYSIINWKL